LENVHNRAKHAVICTLTHTHIGIHLRTHIPTQDMYTLSGKKAIPKETETVATGQL
jgi:hypothetical protein